MKRLIALLLGVALIASVAVVAGPSLVARPVYSVPQLEPGLTPRHNVWGGHSVWARAVAILGRDVGTYPNTLVPFDHAPTGSSPGFSVWVKQPNLTFTVLSWEASVAHAMPGLRWLYGEHPGVYRVRFFQPTWCLSCWCLSCPVGQLE